MFNVLLYYKYIEVLNPEDERVLQLELCQRLGLKGRILLGREGINGTVAGSVSAVNEYIRIMNQHQLFSGTDYKSDECEEIPFKRLSIKVRDEIVTLGISSNAANGGIKVSPEQFNQMLSDPDVVLFDARNNYESAIGRFTGAITPDISLFKDLPKVLGKYEKIKDKKVVTYCTGGIRCEKASALMKKQGFKNVYQLDGGIINYGQKFPDGAFKGRCYVFDERMSVAFKDAPEKLGICHFCESSTNDYQNCANVRCNDLILVCTDCQANTKTLCLECTASPLPQNTV